MVTSDIRLYVSGLILPSTGLLIKEGVEKEKTGCRRGRLHPFFTSQHFYYSAKKEKSQVQRYGSIPWKHLLH